MVKKLRLIARAEAGLNIKPVYSSDKPCKVLVTVYAPTRRRLDPPNLYPTVKALIDGLTDANLWPDDNHEVIKMMSFQYGVRTTDIEDFLEKVSIYSPEDADAIECFVDFQNNLLLEDVEFEIESAEVDDE